MVHLSHGREVGIPKQSVVARLRFVATRFVIIGQKREGVADEGIVRAAPLSALALRTHTLTPH